MDKTQRMRAPAHQDWGNSAQPIPGFVYPERGDTIECLRDYELSDSEHTVLHAGTKGTVTGLRLPGSFDENHGYIGCIVFFNEAAKKDYRDVPYPCGFVIPWDFVSCPENFRFEKPKEIELAA